MAPRRISQEAVVAEARKLFSEGRDPTMDELATAVGVSRAALYQLVGSRAALIEALGLEHPSSGERIVAAAAELLAERGLARLSIDDVAARAGASRATAYRLFPGKGPLLREVLRTYVPMEQLTTLLESMWDRPPSEVMPALGRSLALAGQHHVGVLRSVLFELSGANEEAREAVAYSMRAADVLHRYLENQMAAGRLRTTSANLAAQAFVAPIVVHLINRPFMEEHLGLDLSLEAMADEHAAIWLRGMAPPRRRASRLPSEGAPKRRRPTKQ